MNTATESNALISLNLNLPAPTVVAEQMRDAIHTIYGKIEEEIAAFTPDVTTSATLQPIASLAYKIARTKTGLDEAAKNVTADQKAIIDAVSKVTHIAPSDAKGQIDWDRTSSHPASFDTPCDNSACVPVSLEHATQQQRKSIPTARAPRPNNATPLK